METMNNYNGTILLVDLDSKECETKDLSEELIEKALGGAAINMELYEQYKDRDPMVLGTGFFTATFMPAACAGVITGKSPVTGRIAHVPFGWQTGVELKLTGFDFVVIMGKSQNPVRLWLHDGLSDIDDSTDIWGKDTWESADKIREIYGDDMIQMFLIGKAGENRIPIAQVSENYWGSKDKAGLGAVFGEKKIKAIAMRGLGSLEVAEGYFQKCMELKNEILNGPIKGKSGLKDIAVDLGMDSSLTEKLQSLTHRNDAAYNCPYPYYTFLKYREAPSVMAMKGGLEPGCLISDLSGFASLHGAGLDAPQAMEKCCKLGLDPTSAGHILKKQGASGIDALEKLAEDGKSEVDGTECWVLGNSLETEIVQAASAFSLAVPPKGIFANKGESAEWWVHRQALAYILGLDPVIMLMTPAITDEKLVELIQASAEWDEFTLDDLQRIATELIEKSK
jgi:aldehyde:ferredoxin oxidoreductase